MTRYVFDPGASSLGIHARSSVHPINTKAAGVTGQLDLTLAPDGTIDLGEPVTASLRFELASLSSGNPLYDRETERRIEVRTYPVVDAVLTAMQPADAGAEGGDEGARYTVTGALTFHGVTRTVTGEIAVRVRDDGVVSLSGEQTIDVREWKIDPPRLGLLRVHPDVRVVLEVQAAPEG